MSRLDLVAFAEDLASVTKAHIAAAVGSLALRLTALETRLAGVTSGKDGAPGERGPIGERGEKGERGEAGPPGADGKDGTPGEPGPVGARGVPGERGEAGDPGLHGKDGAPGDRGQEGPPGATGRDGRDGQPGPAGEKGIDGRDGAPGQDGAHGRDGIDGKDGLGFDDIQVDFDGERRFTFRFIQGDRVKVFGPFMVPAVIYREVYREGQPYVTGDAVTWAGSLWIAKTGTAAKPGTPESGWTLAVKRGSDGPKGLKGDSGPQGPQGPQGRAGVDLR